MCSDGFIVLDFLLKFEQHWLQWDYNFLSSKSCEKKRNESKEAVLKLFLDQMDQNTFDSVFDGRMKYGHSNKNQSMFRILNYLDQLAVNLVQNPLGKNS